MVPLPRSFWIAYSAVLLLVAGVGASSDWLDAPGGQAGAAWPYVVDELTSVALIFALTPPVWRLTLRLDPRRIGWAAAGFGHLLGTTAFCTLHVAGMILLRTALYPLFGGPYSGGQDWFVDVARPGGLLVEVEDDELDRLFKALGDPTRRRILDNLRERPKQSLSELCALAFAEDGKALSRQAITQHLNTLQEAGLVCVEWKGRTKLHCFDPSPLREAVTLWLRKHL